MRFRSIFVLVAASVLLFGQVSFARQENSLLSIGMDAKAGSPTVVIRTERPVGYSYTVYDSFDPVRVVVDFPGMDVSKVADKVTFSDVNVQGVRVSSFDLESGKLGRVEIMLARTTDYDVRQDGTTFAISFKSGKAATTIGEKLKQPQAGEKQEKKTVSAPEAASTANVVSSAGKAGSVKSAAVTAATPETVARPKVAAAGTVDFSGVDGTRASFVAPGMERYQYFRLAGPPRLVVDIYGVKPAFRNRNFSAGNGFSRVRVGVYKDKTRFVFDAENGGLPAYDVAQVGNAVVVDWSGKAIDAGNAKAETAAPAGKSAVKPSSAVPVAIEALDFDSKDGISTFTIRMSGPGELIPAVQDGDIVRFGVANATISRSLRRVIDASSFPSAVKLITPYIVQNGSVQEVRFAAELKGPVSYRVRRSGNEIVFTTEDGAFAEFAPPAEEKVAVPVEPAMAKTEKSPTAKPETIEAVIEPEAKKGEAEVAAERPATMRIEQEKPRYTGEKISLVFDNADIRQILQLIADVSGLNIIASDEIKGSITLRLIDVPWDQALDLIMDIKDLGMLREGNIARILPRARIRSMEEAKLTARRTKERLEDLATEVIMVSHTDLANVSGPASELLTERGKITEDARNKQIIVTDVPSVIEKIKQLVKILDTPERQVLIESRIVEANSNFARDLGVKWGYSYDQQRGGATGDKFAALDNASLGLGGSFLLAPGAISGGSSSGLGTSFTFGRLGVDSSVLDLRISALETAGHGKVVSQPRIATLNGEPAMISQGTKIPYQSVSDEGTETKFENAELKLEVTPVINPDDTIILEIVASNSSVGATVPTGVGDAIAIDEKKAETKVLVRDGETTVIGGIFVEDERYSESGVPVLMHIPFVGGLFRSSTKSNERRELLIFITPRIMQ
ncbi:type IV pilus assembly protein PilQ [Geothermobacter ehrlichii]|uniref:Type IV pilus assembly protein PilQ n=1 Tax=Geothermobacter ehrlichii TaxID=213224 RepID=A0A5D3WM84_9BACT|nr:type IV pilus secretin family protein [Geothermobacter ehrlichii]TYO99960.1 type IV pilus assembly protein PilQ [Geothermobacter ehrlichii]